MGFYSDWAAELCKEKFYENWAKELYQDAEWTEADRLQALAEEGAQKPEGDDGLKRLSGAQKRKRKREAAAQSAGGKGEKGKEGGAAARSKHTQASEPGEQETQGQLVASSPSQLPCWTIPCKFFLKGKCTREPDCKFSHKATQQPLVLAPDQEASIDCRMFLRGACRAGNKCPFRHSHSKVKEESTTKASTK